VVVTIGFTEDFDGLVVVLDRLVVFLQAFLRVGQVRQTLPDLHVESAFESVLLYDQGTLVGLLCLDELPLVEVNVPQSHQN